MKKTKFFPRRKQPGRDNIDNFNTNVKRDETKLCTRSNEKAGQSSKSAWLRGQAKEEPEESGCASARRWEREVHTRNRSGSTAPGAWDLGEDGDNRELLGFVCFLIALYCLLC